MSPIIRQKKKKIIRILLILGLIIPTSIISCVFKQEIAKIISKENSLSETEIKKIAESVTFKIFNKDINLNIGGSGVLIAKQDNTYFVITNNHVVESLETQYQIKTNNNKYYPIKIIKQNNQNSIIDDLALITFKSDDNYTPIKINSAIKITENQSIIASGFPLDQNLEQSTEIKHTLGTINTILSQPLKGGYQFGYTNTISRGMSGGAIINYQGELIGINGLGKYPALGNPYTYQNGIEINNLSWEEMSQLSWGIPIKSIKDFVDYK